MNLKRICKSYGRFISAANTVLLYQLLFCAGAHAQNTDKKTFLGEYWSTRPDTSISRRFWGYASFGYGIKYENLNFPSQYPWMLGGPPGNITSLNFEVGFGNTSKLSVMFPFSIGGTGKSGSYSDAFYTYNCGVSDLMFSAGFMVGRQLFPKSHSLWLKNIIPSLGFVYESTDISSTCTSPALPNTTISYDYSTGSILLRAQLMYEIPGFFITNKTYTASMSNIGLVIKAGYDVSLLNNLASSSLTGTSPTINLSGFYVSAGLYFNDYINKAVQKKEMDAFMEAQKKLNADTSRGSSGWAFGIGGAGGYVYSNYNSIRLLPWMLGTPSNTLPQFFAELYFGKPEVLYVSLPIVAGSYNKTGSFSDSNSTFNSTVSTTIISLGGKVGRELLHNDIRHFFNALYTSVGLIYTLSINSAYFLRINATGMDDVGEYDASATMMNFQAMVDLFDITFNKQAVKAKLDFVLTGGYNLPLGPLQWQSSSVFAGNIKPSGVNIGGAYINLGINYWVYFRKHSK